MNFVDAMDHLSRGFDIKRKSDPQETVIRYADNGITKYHLQAKTYTKYIFTEDDQATCDWLVV